MSPEIDCLSHKQKKILLILHKNGRLYAETLGRLTGLAQETVRSYCSRMTHDLVRRNLSINTGKHFYELGEKGKELAAQIAAIPEPT